MKHTIDAKGKTIGRIASAAAKLLMGKDSPMFERHIAGTNTVMITNAAKVKIDPKKLTTKLYEKYSGYPGGFREDTLAHVIEKKGYGEVFKLAVYGMLPANKLRPKIMKNLIVTE